MMAIKDLSQKELLDQLTLLVRQEKELTLVILDYLREVELRQLFLTLGYPTLFAFVTGALGYCAGSAQLRIQAMRALCATPEIRLAIENNSLPLSLVAVTQSLIQTENRALRKSHQAPLCADEQRELFLAVEGKPARDAQAILLSTRHAQDVARALKDNNPPPPPRTLLKKVHFAMDPATEACLEEIKDLMSHTNPHRDLSELMQALLPLALEMIKKKKGLAGNNKKESAILPPVEDQCSKGPSPAPAISYNEIETHRYIPQNIRRTVWQRDGGQCQYIDPATKRKCHSKHLIQFDHVLPFSYGGTHTVEGLFLTCAAHNRYRWRKHQRQTPLPQPIAKRQ